MTSTSRSTRCVRARSGDASLSCLEYSRQCLHPLMPCLPENHSEGIHTAPVAQEDGMLEVACEAHGPYNNKPLFCFILTLFSGRAHGPCNEDISNAEEDVPVV